ncbi:MAG TPA: hypothetical protein DEB42_00585 [Jeotgalicoccus sp.]|nr:hypothetical protein [Jeotgalicoccus sp.]
MQFYINDVMNDNLYIEDSFEIPSLNTEQETREIRGRDGFLLGDKKVKGYNFVIPFIYVNHEKKNYQDIVNEIVEHMITDDEVRLRFENEYWYWNVLFSGTIEFKQKTQGFISFELNCIVIDPFKHSNELYNTVSQDDHLTLYNRGTAPTYPIFRATARKDSTMLMVAKNDEDYFMIGESEDTEKDTKELAPFKFNDEFNKQMFLGWNYTQQEWSYGAGLDGGDADGGTFTFNNNSMHVKDWGSATATNYHGASVQKSIGESLQDFSFMFKIGVRQTVDGSGKSFAYLYDESNKLAFSIGYANTATSRNMGAIVVNAYNTYGEAERIYTRHTDVRDKRLADMSVFMKLQRRGQEIRIETYKFDEHGDSNRRRVRDSHTQIYHDTGDLYQNKVRIIHLYSSKSKNHSNFQRHFILGVYIQQLITDDRAIPITIRAGDVVVVDNQNQIVTINDEPVTHLKDFGANYFDAPANVTEIFFTPEDTFDVQAEWRDRFY